MPEGKVSPDVHTRQDGGIQNQPVTKPAVAPPPTVMECPVM